ncbi:uncharacterized protein [Spinacia oleracea]|uniref:Uncharacterized protein n=1 Tax=Spinacia oleracea TaxID=3562 RepID=A0ABM3RIM3_SPIOL|nr:uncharacterized protein LOC130469947 [Spinacia oleracea]
MGYDLAGQQRKLSLQELEDIRLEAYKNAQIYKDKTKAFQDKRIVKTTFSMAGPFVITNIFPHGAVEITSVDSDKVFKVNGHRLKAFYECEQAEMIEEIKLLKD